MTHSHSSVVSGLGSPHRVARRGSATDYVDFEVQLGPCFGEKLLVRVLQAPLQVEDACECHVDISALTAPSRGFARNFTLDGGTSQNRAEIADLGSRLFEALFAGEVLELFSACLLSLPEKRGLRVCLRINPRDSTLAPLQYVPWELLRVARKDRFLALSKRTPIIRTLQARKPRCVAYFGSPTRVLLVSSQPPGTATLALPEEVDRLRTILRNPHFELEVLKNPDIRSFRHALAKGNFHILHYMGHGDFDTETGDGVLLLRDAHEPAGRVRAWHLATAVKDLQSLSLVILNACSTACFSSNSEHNPFAGLASSFLNSGIPRVVAMQAPIRDHQAIQFSSTFYEELAVGASVEEAVTEARKALLDDSPETADWSIPVLFLSTSDSPLPEPSSLRKATRSAVLLLLLLSLMLWHDSPKRPPTLLSNLTPPSPTISSPPASGSALSSFKTKKPGAHLGSAESDSGQYESPSAEVGSRERPSQVRDNPEEYSLSGDSLVTSEMSKGYPAAAGELPTVMDPPVNQQQLVQTDVADSLLFESLPVSPSDATSEKMIGDSREGRIIFNVTPGDALIYIDGKHIGMARILKKVTEGVPTTPGDLSIGIGRTGYEPHRRDLSIRSGETITVDVSLTPESDPPEAPRRGRTKHGRPCMDNFSEEGGFFKGTLYKTWQSFSNTEESIIFKKMTQSVVVNGWSHLNANDKLGVITALNQETIGGQGGRSPLNIIVEPQNDGEVRVEAAFTINPFQKVSSQTVRNGFCKLLEYAQ